MQIGTLDIELEIAHAKSLKDKRAVLNRIKSRVSNKFNVSIAETEGQNVWNYACLGIAVVTNDQKQSNRVLSKVVDHIEDIGDCEIVDYSMEYLNLG